MKYIIGLDNGGTSTKAAVFTTLGEMVGAYGMPTQRFTPKPGFVECDMEEVWQANCAVIQGVLQKTGIQSNDVIGLSICGHGKGLYLWGKDGKPAYRGISSSDNRAASYQIQWSKDGTEKKAFALSCQHVMACQPVALLAWLRDHEPEVLENTQWVFECKDYVRFRFTGAVHGEITDYSGTNLVNLHTKYYDIRLLQLFGIESVWDALPPLCKSTDICGEITPEAAVLCGLNAGTPVIAGMFDINACALAMDITDESKICMIAGTWSINEYITTGPITNGSVRMNSLYCIPGYYLIEESSATSAGNSEWFIRQLLPEVMKNAANVYDVINGWVEEIQPEEFVPVFLPFVMASNVNPNAKSAFIGLCANHTRRHMARSVYEGVAFSHRYHFEKLMASRKVPPDTIRLAGGVARSAVWMQIFADVMQLPVESVKDDETGAHGCAIAAAYAVGEYTSLKEAIKCMTSIDQTVLPDPAKKEIYDRKYALYCKAIECLDPLWDDMQLLAE